MIRSGGEEHVRHQGVIGPGAHRRDDAALCPLRVAHLDESSEPPLERSQIHRLGR